MPPDIEETAPPLPTLAEIIAETEANAARVRSEQAATEARLAEARAALDAANAAALLSAQNVVADTPVGTDSEVP